MTRTIPNLPVARTTHPRHDIREGNSAVDYEALPLAPPVKAIAVTNVGTLAGSAGTKTLSALTTSLEIADLTKPIVLNWDLSVLGHSKTFAATDDTFADTISATNYDAVVLGGQAPKLFAIPEGAISYTYDNVGAAGTPIIIER